MGNNNNKTSNGSNPDNKRSQLAELLEIMARLRGEEGCPWDRKQTHESLRPYVVEEAYEVVEAIDGGDNEEIREELGDLLLQIVFHSQIASEAGTFSFDDVARAINEKLVRRHPHVFDEAYAATEEEVLMNWERELRHHWVVGRPKRRADYIGDRGRRAEPRKP